LVARIIIVINFFSTAIAPFRRGERTIIIRFRDIRFARARVQETLSTSTIHGRKSLSRNRTSIFKYYYETSFNSQYTDSKGIILLWPGVTPVLICPGEMSHCFGTTLSPFSAHACAQMYLTCISILSIVAGIIHWSIN